MNASGGLRLARATWRALWFAVIPALVSAVYLRYLTPSPYSDELGELGQVLAARICASPLVAGALLFLGCAALIRYWRFWLPGGRTLLPLRPALARQLSGEDCQVFEAALELSSSLRQGGAARPLLDQLEVAQREPCLRRLAELESALEEPDARAVRTAANALSAAAGAPLSAWRRRRALRQTLPLLLALAAALVLRGKLLQSYRVESGSMLPSLVPGALVLASKLSPERLPERGDVVVFRRAGARREDELVKRVIGLPGDHVSMSGGFPVINGWPVPHCDAGRYASLFPGGEFDGRLLVEFLGDRAYLTVYSAVGREASDYQVKQGEVFVLGDNRNESLDSRFWNDGRPGGLPLADLDARVNRVLTAPRADGTPRFDQLLRGLDLRVELPGVDVENLNSGIQRCLAQRPGQTHPPGADTQT